MKKNLVVCLILILIICNITFQVFAENIEELVTQQNDIQSLQDVASTELEYVQEELSNMLMQVQELNTNIQKYEDEVNGLNERISELEKSILEIEERLKIAQINYGKQKKTLEDRIVALYEAGETTYLDVILKSRSITEFISNYYLISEITGYDTELLESVEKEKNRIETSKKVLESQKSEFSSIKANREKTAIILHNTKVVKDSYMGNLTAQEKEIQEKIDLYTFQIREIELEIRQVTGNIDTKYIGGIMAWPVPGYTRITSVFGMRTHPITGIYKLHTGVDIGAPIGANFIATNDGIVVKAGYNGAYGNMVIVDHGGGISTLYAHGNEIVVTLGQTVKKGDVILKIGSTGYSTGPHAHFEVRENGVPVNPITYITSTEKKTEE